MISREALTIFRPVCFGESFTKGTNGMTSLMRQTSMVLIAFCHLQSIAVQQLVRMTFVIREIFGSAQACRMFSVPLTLGLLRISSSAPGSTENGKGLAM